MKRYTTALVAVSLTLICAAAAQAQFVAEQVTVGNAATDLFGGTDADGGIDDWYLSNGVVEAIIDDPGLQTGLPIGVPALPKQNESGFTGGTLLDLGYVGDDNDQLGQMFTVGGLSTSNFILYDTVVASTTATSATISVSGTLLGFAPVDLDVVTDYTVNNSDSFVTITTRVTNVHPTLTATGLGGFLDAFLWTIRGMLPFSAQQTLGFRHAELDFSNLIASLETPLYAAAIGTVKPADGVMDTVLGAASGETAYGLAPVEISRDPDGAGPLPPVVTPVDALFGISNTTVSAFGNSPSGSLAPGELLTYERRVHVGRKNHVAAVSNDILTDFGTRLGFGVGTISGDINGDDTPDVPASVTARRTGGPVIAAVPTGMFVTHFRTDATGAFSGIVLPEGNYQLSATSAERATGVATVSVSAGGDTVANFATMPAVGTVVFEVVEKVGPDKLPISAKATFIGIKGSATPQFGKDIAVIQFSGATDTDLEAQSFGGGLSQGRWAFIPSGAASLEVKPGKYEIYVSAGPEYTLKRKKASVKAGKTKTVKIKLKRTLLTPDAISADFHIHSARSFDASAPPEGRVVSFASEGLEVMVSTDHDFIFDYAPVITALGLDAKIASLIGTEVTSSVPNPPVFSEGIGHLNAWPLVVDADAPRDGAIEDEYLAPNMIYSRLRAQGATVIQYNHPRAGVAGLTSIGFFTNLGCGRCQNDIDATCTLDTDCPALPAPQSCGCVGYQPDRALTMVPNDSLLDDDVTGTSGVANPDGYRNIDFEVLEIGNAFDPAGWLSVRDDWFSLLNQTGLSTPSGPVPFIAGSGVSDSHRMTIESAGYFRTYVLGVGDDPGTLDKAAFNTNIAAGRMMATTGPFIEMSVSDTAAASADIGGTLDPATSDVTVDIRVSATHWVPVDEVRVIVNGTVVATFDGTTIPEVKPGQKKPWSGSAKAKIERFNASVPLTLAVDSWIMVEAGDPISPLPAPDPFADQILPGYVSIAFTNPVFIDLDGDGFDAPGVPVLPREMLARERVDVQEAQAEHAKQHGHFFVQRITIPGPEALD